MIYSHPFSTQHINNVLGPSLALYDTIYLRSGDILIPLVLSHRMPGVHPEGCSMITFKATFGGG